MLPQTSAPPNEHMKNVFRKWPFSHQKCDQNWPKKKLWLDIYVEKRVWAKKSAKLVIPVRSTFQNDSHPPIGGPHPVLYFTTQIKKEYCTAMCYRPPLLVSDVENTPKYTRPNCILARLYSRASNGDFPGEGKIWEIWFFTLKTWKYRPKSPKLMGTHAQNWTLKRPNGTCRHGICPKFYTAGFSG